VQHRPIQCIRKNKDAPVKGLLNTTSSAAACSQPTNNACCTCWKPQAICQATYLLSGHAPSVLQCTAERQYTAQMDPALTHTSSSANGSTASPPAPTPYIIMMLITSLHVWCRV
jgi:hypothetical protein